MTPTGSAKLEHVDFQAINTTLSAGECIGLPTETVYGLAADATNGHGVARIFEMKGRPTFNPLICHVSGIEMAKNYSVFSAYAEKLAEVFWPGPLTLVLPLKAGSNLHPLVTAELGTVGMRHPKGIASQIIEQFGTPLAAPSANPSGKISPTTAAHVKEAFPDLLTIDNGACAVGLESTILKVVGDTVTLLRPGAVTAKMVETTIGVKPVDTEHGKIEAPGMMLSHYAPNALVQTDVEIFTENSSALTFGNPDIQNGIEVFHLSKNADLVEAAANLYAGLKTLDKNGASLIEVSPIPNEGLGVAINDRLKRAAAPRGEE